MKTLLEIVGKKEYIVKGKEQESVTLLTKDFILITIINLLIFFGFQMLMPTFPVYIKKLGGEDSIVGLVAGIFTVSSLAARLLSGMALDRIGRRGVFLVGLGIFTLAVLSYNWLPTIGLILTFRLIHGLGWGASSTASSTIASDSIPQERFGEGMGYFSLASSLPIAIAPAVGLFIISNYSFNILFFVSAALAALGFLLSLALKYRKIEMHEQPKAKAAFFDKSAIRPSIVIFFITVSYGTVVSFLPLYAAQEGIQNIGLFFTVYALALLISRPVFGRISDRLGYNFAIIPGLICVLITMVLLSQSSIMPMFLITAFIYGIGFGAVVSSLQAMAVVNSTPNRRGAANATFFTGFDSGIGLGAIIFGAVASAVGYSRMYLWAVVPVVLAFILYFAVANNKMPSVDVDNE